MLKIERYSMPSPLQWEMIIDGMRNPMNSWEKSDTEYSENHIYMAMGDADLNLMNKLAKAGPVHGKYRRMIAVYVDINAPLYWWKEFDTYKVGTVANSCSTMHKLMHKEFEVDDFSHEHMDKWAVQILKDTIRHMNYNRNLYLASKIPEEKKQYWWNIIQLLPTSYNQMRTVMLNYEVLANIYETRRNHKLDEWIVMCDWIENLPYSELITGK